MTGLNRITSYTNENGKTIKYNYDGNGNLIELIYPDEKIVRYSYNANNQLAKVQDWNNRITIYDYYENGNLKSETRPDGSTQTYIYDELGQLSYTIDKAKDGSIINEYSYEYDADGNVITENSLYEPDYDNLIIPSEEMLYGNANQLVDFNGNTISYDADGNMLNTPLDNEWGELTYNSQNLLTDVATQRGNIKYQYDVEGYRIAKTENGIATNYVVNPNAELSQVLMAEKDGKTIYYIYGLGLIGEEKADTYKTYHYDYRGSTTAITDENGIVTDRVYYDVYGNILSKTGTTDTPFLYVGKYGVETDDCGLYYMRARYYNPTIQRFVNVDPIRNGYNWYGYVSGNSINSIDPTGYFDWTSKKQWGMLWDGMYSKMDEFSNYVFDGNKEFWSNPIKNLSLLAEYGSQDAKNTFVGGVDAIKAHMRGDINLWDVGKEYIAEKQAGIENTIKAVGTGIWQLSPFSKVSDEDVYKLGYNLEGALLSASEAVLVTYVGAKLPGIAKSVAGKISPKLKSATNKLITVLKDNKGGFEITNPFYKKGRNVWANNIADGEKLREYYRQAEKYGTGSIKELSDGRYRFYEKLKLAEKKGEMKGARHVREWNPYTGQKRDWYETLDHYDNIRQVRPSPDITKNIKVHYMFDNNGNYINSWSAKK